MGEPSDLLSSVSEILGTRVCEDSVEFPSFHWQTHEQAKQVLREVKRMERQLRQLKKRLNYEISRFKSQSTMSRLEVGHSFASALGSLMFGRSSMGRINAATRQDMRRAQLEALKPYERFKALIDEALHRLSEVKHEIEISQHYGYTKRPPKNAYAITSELDYTKDEQAGRTVDVLPAAGIGSGSPANMGSIPLIRPPIGFSPTHSGRWSTVVLVTIAVVSLMCVGWWLFMKPSWVHQIIPSLTLSK